MIDKKHIEDKIVERGYAPPDEAPKLATDLVGLVQTIRDRKVKPKN